MNLALTDPFILAQDYPEALTGKLSRFNVDMATSHTLTAYDQGLATRPVLGSTAEGIS